ncbi:hypothetical protein FKM82_022185 [Ascaphus truei]
MSYSPFYIPFPAPTGLTLFFISCLSPPHLCFEFSQYTNAFLIHHIVWIFLFLLALEIFIVIWGIGLPCSHALKHIKLSPLSIVYGSEDGSNYIFGMLGRGCRQSRRVCHSWYFCKQQM